MLSIEEIFLQAISDILDSGWYVLGDINKIQEKIIRELKAILVVHLYGRIGYSNAM
jgi:dTDP-4-amino-4,6-dideoxygalactose transaminase